MSPKQKQIKDWLTESHQRFDDLLNKNKKKKKKKKRREVEGPKLGYVKKTKTNA